MSKKNFINWLFRFKKNEKNVEKKSTCHLSAIYYSTYYLLYFAFLFVYFKTHQSIEYNDKNQTTLFCSISYSRRSSLNNKYLFCMRSGHYKDYKERRNPVELFEFTNRSIESTNYFSDPFKSIPMNWS